MPTALKYGVLAVACLLLSLASHAQPDIPAGWLTHYETSGYKRTPSYAETIAYCRKLDAASEWVKYTSFGVSPQGRDLPLVILSKEQAFDPARAAATGKAIILIQSGIHSGEIDGKDASLMLMREIAITKSLAALLDSTILLFVPIFSVDGHERSGPYNRINQNGPEEMGWRTTAVNLNLNRDYMKADAQEMRAMLRLFSSWLPDYYVDCHVTDGMDFQYDVTYAMDTSPLVIDPEVAHWVKEQHLPLVLPAVERAGHKIFWYVFPREDNDLSKGLLGGTAPPRFSTGFGSLHNRPTLLIETHMLKPYRIRVSATYHLLKAVVENINEAPHRLRRSVRNADARVVAAGSTYSPARFVGLRFDLGKSFEVKRFLGVQARMEPSDISGTTRVVYFSGPMETDVAFYNEVTVIDSVIVPLAYIVPQEWQFVTNILSTHGVMMETLKDSAALDVESYRFTDVQWRPRPYEGRQVATYRTDVIRERRPYPAGTVVVRMNQRSARVALHLLEPNGPDSFVAWGFFNTIFEQKEYAERYVMEEMGRRMLEDDPALKQEFLGKVNADTSFARNPSARLNWLYQRSPWADPWLNKYPIARVVMPPLPDTEPLEPR